VFLGDFIALGAVGREFDAVGLKYVVGDRLWFEIEGVCRELGEIGEIGGGLL
jgi:hypothetical protein